MPTQKGRVAEYKLLRHVFFIVISFKFAEVVEKISFSGTTNQALELFPTPVVEYFHFSVSTPNSVGKDAFASARFPASSRASLS